MAISIVHFFGFKIPEIVAHYDYGQRLESETLLASAVSCPRFAILVHKMGKTSLSMVVVELLRHCICMESALSTSLSAAIRLLSGISRFGRTFLVGGLIAGLLLPNLAAALKPHLPTLVALLLFLTAFRVSAPRALGDLSRGAGTLVQVLVLQVALPITFLGALLLVDVEISPFLLAVALMLSAPSVTGAPNFAIMNNKDPVPAMRILVLGTALFPLLVLPVFLLLPQLGGVQGMRASLILVLVILASVGLGFWLRHLVGPRVGFLEERAIDGLNAIALAVIVVGLMSALGPLLRSDPWHLLNWMVAVFCLNIGLQGVAFYIYRGSSRVAVSMIAGNRNVALFLIALPEHVIEPLLIFIGCYQIPMYLTPLVMKRLHDRA